VAATSVPRRPDLHLEPPPERRRPVGNPDQPAAVAIGISDPVVANLDPERPFRHGRPDLGAPGVRVLHDVRERLGHDDSDITPSFDCLARLAAHVLNAPMALVSLVDADRQFFKSCLGLPEPWASERQSPLTHSFCQHAVASREPLLVDDAREHELLHDNLASATWASSPMRAFRSSTPTGTHSEHCA